jgi:hypothetical protein
LLTLVCALTRSEVFCLYAGIGLLTITLILDRMPDRRGRNLQQIQRRLGVPLYRGERRQCGPQDASASSTTPLARVAYSMC